MAEVDHVAGHVEDVGDDDGVHGFALLAALGALAGGGYEGVDEGRDLAEYGVEVGEFSVGHWATLRCEGSGWGGGGVRGKWHCGW